VASDNVYKTLINTANILKSMSKHHRNREIGQDLEDFGYYSKLIVTVLSPYNVGNRGVII